MVLVEVLKSMQLDTSSMDSDHKHTRPSDLEIKPKDKVREDEADVGIL